MPSVTQDQPLLHSPKKRRRDEDVVVNSSGQLSLSTCHTEYPYYSTPLGLTRLPDDYYHTNHVPARKIIPWPNPKRVRVIQDDDRPRFRAFSPTSPLRQSKSPSINADVVPRGGLHETDINGRLAPARTGSSQLLLTRCHICHRKPAKRIDIDSFADCQGCGQRTCFVCLRQCLGWGPYQMEDTLQLPPNTNMSNSFIMKYAAGSTSGQNNSATLNNESEQHTDDGNGSEADRWVKEGHHQVVCSRCCVEKGPDGDIVCLGCLPFVEG
ncbi:hypothetical protein VTK73DRAFT_3251 [Phialemonium thermophilum]|uniref:Uncharacterized protein n=1 Tax=Phialemonium thermophilum TaxID=223376 RepID=A0ABR3Y7K3_9PEZI